MATQTKLFTYDDYLKLPEDSFKYEVLRGELIERQSPPTIHQRISGNLLFLLTDFNKAVSSGEVLPRLDVVLSMTDIVQPDVLFVAKERSGIITDKNVVAAPDLMVEVLSEDTAAIDRDGKKKLYEKHGVKEYWIVGPEEKQIEQYVLRDRAFQLHAQLEASEKLASEVIEGLVLRLSDVFVN